MLLKHEVYFFISNYNYRQQDLLTENVVINKFKLKIAEYHDIIKQLKKDDIHVLYNNYRELIIFHNSYPISSKN